MPSGHERRDISTPKWIERNSAGMHIKTNALEALAHQCGRKSQGKGMKPKHQSVMHMQLFFAILGGAGRPLSVFCTVLDNPGMTLDIIKGNSLLRIQDEKL